MDIIKLKEFTKSEIEKIADTVIQRVEEGLDNPLELYIQLKALEIATEKIKEAIKEKAKSEASKYGKGEYFKGAGLSIRPYKLLDYSKDPIISTLQSQIASRQDILKKAKEMAEKGLQMVDNNGEVIPVIPYKVNTDTLTVSFKK